MMYRLIALFILLFIQSCANKAIQETANAEQLNQPSELSFEAYCDRVVELLDKGDAKTLFTDFDRDRAEKLLRLSIDSSTKAGKELTAGLSRLIDGVLAKNAEALKAFNVWYVLDLEADLKQAECIVHSDIGDDGFSMLKFELGRDRQNTITIRNWYDYANAMSVSENISAVMVAFSSEMDRDTGKRLANAINLAKGKDIELAWQMFSELPINLRNNKSFLTVMLQAAIEQNKLRDEIAREYIQHVKPEDRGTLVFDYLYENKEFDSVLALIATMEKKSKVSVISETLRALVHLGRGDEKGFYLGMYAAIDKNLDYEPSYWILFEELIENQHFDTAVTALEVLKAHFGYEFVPESFAAPKYRKLIESEAFKQWIKTLG